MRRFLFLGLMIGLAYYLAMIFNSESLLLMVFVGIILLFLLEIVNFVTCISLQVSCSLANRTIMAGERILAEVQMKGGILPSGRVAVWLRCKGKTGQKAHKIKIYGHTTPNESKTYQVEFNENGIGQYTVEIIKVRVTDYLGILEFPKRREKKRHRIMILPEIYSVTMDVSPKYALLAQNEVRDSMGNRIGVHQSEIREYVVGDNLRDIHWKLTAKQDKLMVRERKVYGGCGIVLLLESKKIRSPQNQVALIQIAISVSMGIVASGNVLYVAWYSSKTGLLKRKLLIENRDVYHLLHLWVREVLSDQHITGSDNMLGEYQKQFGVSTIPCFLELNSTLALRENGELIMQFEEGELKKQMSGLRISL